MGNTFNNLVGDFHRIGAGLLGNGKGDGGKLTAKWNPLAGIPRSGTKPGILFRLWRTTSDFGHIPQINRFAFMHTNDQILDLFHRTEINPGLNRDFEIIVDHIAGGSGRITLLKGIPQIIHGKIIGSQPTGTEQDLDHLFRSSQGIDIAGSFDAFEFRLQGVSNLVKFVATPLRIICPEGQSNNRHIVDTLGFDNGLRYPQPGRQPILLRVQRVV